MFPRTSLTYLVVLSLSVVNVLGYNDWNTPCFNGDCSYDLPDTNGRSAGSLKIWGSADAISDITPAAGWTILGCSTDTFAQDIRLVCSSDAAEASCNHLFSKGASGKLVRLPETCGKSAFARVARYWIPTDQSIPQNISSSIVRRANAQPLVIALQLDTNFAAIDPAVTGNVSISIEGTTIPGAPGNFTVTPAGSSASRRGILSFVEDAFNDFNDIDESVSTNFTALNITGDYPLFSDSIPCPGPPPFTASISADVNASANAVISLGLAAVGTIVPPELTEFGVFVGLDASFSATLDLVGNIAGTVDTGDITFYSYEIAGLDFPGILSIGPTFKIVGQATANFDVDVNMQAEISYSVSDANIIFPPTANTASTGVYTPNSAPLQLSVSGNSSSATSVVASVGPVIELSIDALSGIASANVYLSFDAQATVTLDLDAAGDAGASVNTTTSDTSGTAAGTVTGCVTVSAGVGANVGADADFFGLFDESTTLSLFSKDWSLYSQCFAASSGITRRYNEERRGLSFSCPSAAFADPVLVQLA